MKKQLTNKRLAILLAVVFTVVATTVMAFPPPPPPPNPNAPIDGGLALLLGVGLTYGAKKLYNR